MEVAKCHRISDYAGRIACWNGSGVPSVRLGRSLVACHRSPPALAAAQLPHKLPRQSAAQMGMTVTTPLVGPNKAIVWPEPQNVRLAPFALCGVARPNPSVHHR